MEFLGGKVCENVRVMLGNNSESTERYLSPAILYCLNTF